MWYLCIICVCSKAKLYLSTFVTDIADDNTMYVFYCSHSSLANCPTEETLAEDPPGLTVSLMTHQKRALAWLEWREAQIPSGGILGKLMTLQYLQPPR